jgi:hypothetical protein
MTAHPTDSEKQTEQSQPRITMPQEQLADFCRRKHIRWLALFGSVLREDFRPDSDVDVLVEFEPEARVTLFTLSHLQRELEDIFARPVDFVMKDGFKRRIRDSVLANAQVV